MSFYSNQISFDKRKSGGKMRSIPLLPYFIPFVAGIWLTDAFPVLRVQSYTITCGVYFILISAIILIYLYNSQYSKRWINGVFCAISMLLLGILSCSATYHRFNHNHYSSYGVPNHFQAQVIDFGVERPKSLRFTVKIIAIYDSTEWKAASGKILLYAQKDSLSKTLLPNDIIYFNGLCQEISHAGNPASFDYKKYMNRKGIYDRIYLKSGQWKKCGQTRPGLLAMAQQIRQILLKQLATQEIKGDEYAVASAILLGYDDFLEPELRKTYSGSGAMHILCVSGLHVGIIFLISNILLSFLVKFKNGRQIRAVLIILVIWLYAMISGLSPSVSRAATMFSFVSAGMILKRDTPIYNTLLASAFFILLFKPLILFEIGFQLSYAAVLAIVSFEPYLSSLWKTDNKMLKYIRGLISVSLAAQAGTFAIALFYFHQFPNYFLLTNILVIPLSFVVMISGVLSLAVMWIPYIGIWAVKLLGFLIRILNLSVQTIETLPFSVSKGLFIQSYELIMIILILIMIALWFHNRKNRLLAVSLGILCLLFISLSLRQFWQLKQQKLIIYNTPGHFSADFIQGKAALHLCDSAFSTKTDAAAFYLSNSRASLGISEISTKNINETSAKSQKILFNNLKIIICQEIQQHKKDSCDIFILNQSNAKSLRQIQECIYSKIYIADASNKQWRVKKWQAEADEYLIPFYDVSSSGAFIIDNTNHK